MNFICFMTAKLAKPVFLLGVAYMVQVKDLVADSTWEKVMEHGLAFMLLALACVILFREWKSSDKYNKARDDRLEKLIDNNNNAMREVKDSIDKLSDGQEQFREELKLIHRRIDKNMEMISD